MSSYTYVDVYVFDIWICELRLCVYLCVYMVCVSTWYVRYVWYVCHVCKIRMGCKVCVCMICTNCMMCAIYNAINVKSDRHVMQCRYVFHILI